MKKKLTLVECKNLIEELQNELELYLTKKRINFLKTQPTGSNYDKILTSKTNNIFDSFTHYAIKDEECDEKIYSIQLYIEDYKNYMLKEMQRMSKYDEIGLIYYLHNELKYPWEKIDKLLYRASGVSRVKYARFKKKENDNECYVL